jgi:tetratricopeptide (TPR) repeat protein
MWMVHHDQAQILQKIGRIAAAETAVRKGLPFLEELAAADPGDKGHQRGIAVTYLTLGDILGGLHRTREAQASYRMAIVRSEGLLAADPHKIETTKDLARIYSHSGLLWLRSGKFAETRKALDRARELFDWSATVDPGDAQVAAGRSEAYQGLDELARRSPGSTGLH